MGSRLLLNVLGLGSRLLTELSPEVRAVCGDDLLFATWEKKAECTSWSSREDFDRCQLRSWGLSTNRGPTGTAVSLCLSLPLSAASPVNCSVDGEPAPFNREGKTCWLKPRNIEWCRANATFQFLDYLASFDAADGHAYLHHLPSITRAKLAYLPAPDV